MQKKKKKKVGLHSAQPIILSIFYIAPFFLTSWFTPFHIFFFLLFSHPHTSSHTPRFPLFSVLNFLSSLSFYVVFLFLLLFSCVCVFFNLRVLHLIWLFSTSHSSFSLWLFCFAFFFLFFCKSHLFISFISSSIYIYFFGWDFSFIVQTPCQLNLEFQPVFIEGFLIERVRRGFLV